MPDPAGRVYIDFLGVTRKIGMTESNAFREFLDVLDEVIQAGTAQGLNPVGHVIGVAIRHRSRFQEMLQEPSRPANSIEYPPPPLTLEERSIFGVESEDDEFMQEHGRSVSEISDYLKSKGSSSSKPWIHKQIKLGIFLTDPYSSETIVSTVSVIRSMINPG